MSSDRRPPWWYSGDDDQPEPEVAVAPDADADADADADITTSTMDWTALVAGAAKMVDWATERVMAPHAEHSDPAEHPECMVCRTVTLIGDPVGLMGSGQPPLTEPEPAGDDAAGPTTGAQPIRWIPIVETGD